MGYTLRFSMMILSHFRRFWIAVGIPIFRWFMFMPSAYAIIFLPVLDLTYPKNQDFSEVFNYLFSVSRRYFFPSDCTNWIRRSTGRLCAELTPSNYYLWLDQYSPKSPASSGIYSWNAADAETITTFIDSLTLEQYHHICDRNLRQQQHFDLSASTTANLGAVLRRSNDLLEDSVEIAFLPNAAPIVYNWSISGRGTTEIMPNGWTRYFFIG
ncbi:hypothetical protein MSAN_00127000 [Mycena sanguinolenta]|uniref:Uncharacterized protein n=1 Tax=Mycena sanguinolenta TaxID=230812 RepID=A0A8H6ZGH1_9AGAR|nr:hypothetical protein MSAN_00127000 [Mycena sanguinolenta]